MLHAVYKWLSSNGCPAGFQAASFYPTRRLRRLSSLLIFSLIAAGDNVSAQVEDSPGKKVMALVGDVKLYQHDVIDNPDVLESLPDRHRQAYCRRRLNRAIDAEVLYQSARKQGLHEDETFIQRRDKAMVRQEQRQLELLAGEYEGQQAELVAARDKSTITDGEVAAHYEKHQDKYRGRTKASALKVIRIQLATARANDVYCAWLKKVVAEVAVHIGSEQLPVEMMAECIDRFHGGTRDHNANTRIDPLWQVILDAADLKMPATRRQFDEAAAKPYIERIGRLELQVGESTYQFCDLRQSDLMARNASVGFPGSTMFNTLKTLIIAEKAHREDVKRVDTGDGVDLERALLTWILFERANIADLDSCEITEEEIELYRTEHSGRFERIQKTRGGEDRVKTLIGRMLKGEKIKAARNEYIRGLRDKIDVKIYEYSSVGALEL